MANFAHGTVVREDRSGGSLPETGWRDVAKLVCRVGVGRRRKCGMDRSHKSPGAATVGILRLSVASTAPGGPSGRPEHGGATCRPSSLLHFKTGKGDLRGPLGVPVQLEMEKAFPR